MAATVAPNQVKRLLEGYLVYIWISYHPVPVPVLAQDFLQDLQYNILCSKIEKLKVEIYPL